MKTSKAAGAWPAKATSSIEGLRKFPFRVKEENREAKEAYIAWRKNCITLLDRPAINSKPPIGADCIKSRKADPGGNPKRKKIPSPERLARVLRLLGARLELVPKTYLDLHQSMPTEETKTFIKKRCEKKKVDLQHPLSARKAYKLVDALQATFPELHRNVAAAYDGALIVEFSKDYFSDVEVSGTEGLCYPLVLKWLADQGTGQTLDFFNDINTCEGHKELMSLLEGQGSIGRYMRGRGLAWEDKSTERFEKIEGDGRYFIRLIDQSSKTAGHAMGAFVDLKSSLYLMFDPNRGVFSFGSEQQINSFLSDYSCIRYRGLRKGRLRLVCSI